MEMEKVEVKLNAEGKPLNDFERVIQATNNVLESNKVIGDMVKNISGGVAALLEAKGVRHG